MGEDVHDVNQRRAARMRGAERYKVKDVEFSIDPNFLTEFDSSPSNTEHRSLSSTPNDGKNNRGLNGAATVESQEVNGVIDSQQAQVDKAFLSHKKPQKRPEPTSSLKTEKRGRPRKNQTPNASAGKNNPATDKRQPSTKKGSDKKRNKQEAVRKLFEPFIQPYHSNEKTTSIQQENEKSPLSRQQQEEFATFEDNFEVEQADSSVRASVSSEAPQERIPSPISSSAHHIYAKEIEKETSTNDASINKLPTKASSASGEQSPPQATDELVSIELTRLSKNVNGTKKLNKFDVIQQLFQELLAEIEPEDPYLLKVKNAFGEHVSIRLLEFIDLLNVNQALYAASRKAAKEKFALQQELSDVRQERLALQNKKNELRLSYREISDTSQKMENLDEFLIECESLKRLLDIDKTIPSDDVDYYSLDEFSNALCGERGIYEQLQELQQLLKNVYRGLSNPT
ncbi:kinetochore protein Mis17 [Schizosaccharomyces cryophilus OY26]|uniref:Kinetochore protein Mis17 n=1 Tax=Schizosaccharomyces cryophilus (strain OY26 / ATCC MYA-4695 / CBS 11777 / NBRC 106824 / NRRL Y48691) TaxID=653667 RepID=S9VRZ5_SCHCR|nr:kinetochore protein Mis17 [Schizosaccharomyces cryophilus OY26]EPY50713.1 kinetochore protein Mis17 [Schizosaccharomyces cryophilus OY26]